MISTRALAIFLSPAMVMTAAAVELKEESFPVSGRVARVAGVTVDGSPLIRWMVELKADEASTAKYNLKDGTFRVYVNSLASSFGSDGSGLAGMKIVVRCHEKPRSDYFGPSNFEMAM